jgi:DNA-binding CsgD family transcriptional regulator
MTVTITAGDLEVFRLVKLGLSNQEIADRLYLTRKTVQNRLARMYKKCGINNRNKLASLSENIFLVGRQRPSNHFDYLPEITKYYSEGLTAIQMAKRLNVSRTTVYTYINKLKRELPIG